MPKVKEILFPVDFSDRSEQVAPQVRLWAERFGARVTLLHAAATKKERSQKSEALREMIARHFGDAVSMVVEDNAAASICELARRFDLIMMPTHGHGVFRQLLIGSTTAKVLHDADCPVWTAAHLPAPRTSTRLPRTILCAVNDDPSMATLMRWAAWLAAQLGAELSLVHAMPAVDESSQNRGEKAVRRYWLARTEAEIVPMVKKAGLLDRLVVRGGDVAAVLAQEARNQRADLLVIGRGKAKKNLGRLRTHSLGIVAKSPCPVVSV